MATRLYFEANTASGITPSFASGWLDTSTAVRRKLRLTQDATTETVAGTLGGAINDNSCAAQLVSPPLDAQTISGTVKITSRSRELASTDNINKRWRSIRVLSGDGSTVRGTLLTNAATTSTTEMSATTLQGQSHNTAVSGDTLTSVVCQAGDVIVLEIGFGESATGTTPEWNTVLGGTGTDHANSNSDVTGTVPWVEFSANLTFASTAVDLTVADAAQGHTADNVTLTVAPIDLTVADAGQGHTADNVTLTVAPIDLTVAAATQAHTADNVPLSVGGVDLAPAAATQAHTADTVTLTVAPINLTVAAATQGHTADNVTLTVAPIDLTVAGATQAHTADNVSLAGGASLAVADALQAQTSANIALTQVHVLTVAAATEAQTADNVALTQTHVLTVAPAVQAQTADAVSLSQTVVLGVVSATHELTSTVVTLTTGVVVSGAMGATARTAQTMSSTEAAAPSVAATDRRGVQLSPADRTVAAMTADIGEPNLANAAFTYTIVKTDPGTYSAVAANGAVVATSTDSTSPLRSGLRAVLVAVAAPNVSIYFPAGLYTFMEDPAGIEDHWAPNGIDGLTVEGDPSRSSILANWRDDSQPGYDTNPDVEPFSFTRCHDLTYRNFRVWAGGNRDANNSSDALDFDGCRGTHVENIIVERSRARGIVYDGGDTGAVSRNGRIIGCEVRGVPPAPSVASGSSGTLAAQEYRYVVTYVDSALGETPPSEVTSFKANGTTRAALRIPTGPAYSATKGVTARKLYRWSEAQRTYRLVTTLDNAATTYNDNASDASIAAAATVPLTGNPLIPVEGIKLLGSNRHLVSDNEVLGVGGHGIQIVRKGSDAATNAQSNGHRVIDNTIRRAGAGTSTAARVGVYIGGGSYNVVQGNNISNVGAVAAQGYGVQVQGLTGAVTEYNTVGPNTIYDDQDADSPTGGVTTKYGVSLSGTPAPDNNVLVPSAIRGMVTSAINDLGTNTKQYASI